MKDNSSVAGKIVARYGQVKTQRIAYDSVYKIITDYIVPFRGTFNSIPAEGNTVTAAISNAANTDMDNTSIQYTSEAAIALNELVSVITNRLTDPTQKWISLKPRDKKLIKSERVKRFLAEVEDLVFEVISSSESGFLQANHEAIHDSVAYGTAVMLVFEEEKNIVFRNIHLSNVWVEEDHKGFIDTVYLREFMTARAAVQRYGKEKLSDRINQAYEKGLADRFEIVNIIMPKKDFEGSFGSVGSKLKNFDYVSVHLCTDDSSLIDIKGFDGNPAIAFRFDKVAGETYGVSPAFKILTDVRILNETQKEFLWGCHMLGNPPLATKEELPDNQIDVAPGGFIQGGIDDEGRQVVQPLQVRPDLNALIAMMDKLALNIRKAFLNDTLRETKGKQPLTATESIHIDEKEKTLLAPQIRRLEAEYLNKLIKRIIILLKRQNKLPEVPTELEGSLDFTIEYTSPLSYTLQSNQAAAFNRFFANAASLLQIDPSGLVNLKSDDAIRYLAEKSGIPLNLIEEEEKVEEIRETQAKAQQQQQELANLQAGAAATADLAKAGINPMGQ